MKKLAMARQNDTQLAQISLNVDRTWECLRVCTANGYLLCNTGIAPNLIESIVIYTWDSQKQCWRGEFLLEERIEKLRVASFEGQRACSDQTIAELLSFSVESAERVRRSAEIR